MMDITHCVMIAVGAALVGILVGYGGVRLLDRFQLDNARARVRAITEAAKNDALNVQRDAELRAKDELFKKREEFNKEMEQARAKLAEQERRIDKREDSLEQKHDAQLKKEKALEHAERKLKERRAELEKRHQEADGLVKQQNQKLHEISALNREQ